MRRALKTDSNQGDIVKALRAAGAVVQSLVRVGDGCPDLMVGWRREVFLLEVKDGSRCPSERRLTALEAAWHRAWLGFRVHVVETPAQALRAIGAISEAQSRNLDGE